MVAIREYTACLGRSSCVLKSYLLLTYWNVPIVTIFGSLSEDLCSDFFTMAGGLEARIRESQARAYQAGLDCMPSLEAKMGVGGAKRDARSQAIRGKSILWFPGL